ncbi:hypothetical protein SAMN04488530_1335 [Asaccharospora irregularis DSM 2635]|uniref:Uncharacterized protein n=1 Tax=Asaccharospora irregularis DSM 2635 TaxID=1121321 RepID=A0A1M5RT73_9FIRM|nr:hypothetical protein SAMN04488530_1335 [Asaccharospora irregularis DSM 2635]
MKNILNPYIYIKEEYYKLNYEGYRSLNERKRK